MALEGAETPRRATREEMRDAKVPMQYRDSCAHLLIPLNRCRFETYYMPWKCEQSNPAPRWRTTPDRRLTRFPQDERHSYEKCQYVEFKKRVAKMNELREAKGGARSN
ncbi:hypothetical protein N657DRAFT_635835 [Parathielavia appendiculata]|uniref:NADH dehydrogenase [ubiquinone] 1 beta subcomplex subunit 7 n=1 Tax=Parathielavia appendiculata TaxID=2587402 RepID=A0AAN6TV07_9PEZI|nr:hypothetical protein N657DRAFT_635835 [Parathielavia appendiculata]